MHNITPETFIETLFPAEMLGDDECVILAHPTPGGYYRQYAATPRLLRDAAKRKEGWLFCVSTARRPPDFGRVRRRKEDLFDAWVLVLDDVGTKSAVPPVQPHYILETSPGNHQFGYMLQPFPVLYPHNSSYYHECLMALAAAGYHDPGAGSASRCVKMPGAIHKTGFVTRCLSWHPNLQPWDLGVLMSAMGVELDPVGVTEDGMSLTWQEIVADDNWSGVSFGDIVDPVSDFIQDRKMYTGQRNTQWLHMVCPWADEHSNDEPGTATSYSPDGYGYAGRQWVCQHGHCAKRNTKTFLDWVESEGGPAVGAERDHSAILADYFGVQ